MTVEATLITRIARPFVAGSENDYSDPRNWGSYGESRFKGEGNGIGPALMWVPVIGDKPVKVVAKVMHEFGVKQRLEGTYGQIQFGFQF